MEWIISHDAKFFERSLPFIGYIEFLFEVPFHDGQRITALKADIGYVLGGMSARRKKPELVRDHVRHWRYKAP